MSMRVRFFPLFLLLHPVKSHVAKFTNDFFRSPSSFFTPAVENLRLCEKLFHDIPSGCKTRSANTGGVV